MTTSDRNRSSRPEHDGNQRPSGNAKAKASDGAHRVTEVLEGNPLGILVGGLAVGAIAGALIPRSDRERELLAPLGRQLGERARAAAGAAREVGKAELADLGISKDAARNQARGLFDGVMKAATSAGTAAKDAAAKPVG